MTLKHCVLQITIEDNLKLVEKIAEDALMYGGSHETSLDDLADTVKQEIFVTSRKYEIDLVGAGKEAERRGAEDAGKENLPESKDALEAALDDAGIDRGGFDNLIAVLPEGGMISEKKMLQNTRKDIMQKLEQGVDPKKDEFLRASIDQFSKDLKRSLEQNDIE